MDFFLCFLFWFWNVVLIIRIPIGSYLPTLGDTVSSAHKARSARK
jgi:hypothetical protein